MLDSFKTDKFVVCEQCLYKETEYPQYDRYNEKTFISPNEHETLDSSNGMNNGERHTHRICFLLSKACKEMSFRKRKEAFVPYEQ